MPKLDRQPYFDQRSRNFGVQRLIAGMPEVRHRRVWTPGPLLDQGQEGHCVGFGCSAELGATPVKLKVDNNFAHQLFSSAHQEDLKMGNHWDDGASVLAGCKAAKNAGLITSYSWCFGIDDVIKALIRIGPVVLGVNWYESMYDTDDAGQVAVGGQLVGGHCICAFGYIPAGSTQGDDVIAWRNSWGEQYGVLDPHTGLRNGVGYIKVSDLSKLLSEGGEAVTLRDNRKALT